LQRSDDCWLFLFNLYFRWVWGKQDLPVCFAEEQ
jgi:hypothetical protein